MKNSNNDNIIWVLVLCIWFQFIQRIEHKSLENGLDQDFAKKDVNLTLKRCRKIPQKRHSAFGPTNNKR